MIRHVLFDADGVLQVVPDGDWYALADPYVGDRAREFLHRAWELERPTLAGRGEFLPLLGALLEETILFIDDSRANVEGARAAGMTAVHWSADDGHDVLLDLLAQHGVDGRRTTATR